MYVVLTYVCARDTQKYDARLLRSLGYECRTGPNTRQQSTAFLFSVCSLLLLLATKEVILIPGDQSIRTEGAAAIDKQIKARSHKEITTTVDSK